VEEFDQVDADFNNIALTELEGANDLDAQSHKEDQAENAVVDCWVTVLGRAVELLSELSRCQLLSELLSELLPEVSRCQNIRMKLIFTHRLAELMDNKEFQR